MKHQARPIEATYNGKEEEEEQKRKRKEARSKKREEKRKKIEEYEKKYAALSDAQRDKITFIEYIQAEERRAKEKYYPAGSRQQKNKSRTLLSGSSKIGGSISAARVTKRFIKNGFETYNLRPNKLHGHGFRPEIYGREPIIEEGKMWFESKFYGTVPVHEEKKATKVYNESTGKWAKTYLRLTPDELEGKDPRKIVKFNTNLFQVSYIVARPTNLHKNELRDIPYILAIPGVPMNAWLKLDIMRQLGKGAFIVAVSMLGMGDSDMPHDYGKEEFPYALPIKTSLDQDNFNRAWDWEHDVDYMHLLMKRHLVRKYDLDPDKKWVVQADDWGAGILMRYACHAEYSKQLGLGIFVNPIFLDGYFVIEIGTIGKLSLVWKMNPDAFLQAAISLPSTMLGIEKYMVLKRWKMNQYTEERNLGTYQDTNYQKGRTAAFMPANNWNLVVLADRSSRLAPRQLQPFDGNPKDSAVYFIRGNPWGCKTWQAIAPLEIIWGMQDQMMPPAQGWRGTYAFPNSRVNFTPIDGADHFSEMDQPDKIVRAMWNAMQRELGKSNVPIFLGNGTDVVFKGDEEELIKRLTFIYGSPDPKMLSY